MSVEVNRLMKLLVRETLTGGSQRNIITHEIQNLEANLNASSSVVADTVASGTITLSAGAFVADLTALVGAGNRTFNFNGKKIKEILLLPASGNSAAVVMTADATNGYSLGLTNENLYAGQPFQKSFGDNLSAVGSSAKRISFTSGDADSTIDFVIVGGA